jgi:hypothetical protein
MLVNRAYSVVPGIQKIPFKICGWIGIAIYCFFYELEVISACFPMDDECNGGSTAACGRRYTAEEVVDEQVV